MVRRAPSQSAPSRPSTPPGDDVDERPFFDTVDELQQHGINVQDILKLKSAAINTVSGVNMTTRRQMLKIKGMSEAKVEKIKEAAHKILGSSFATGLEVQDKRKRVLLVSTGSKAVDTALGGAHLTPMVVLVLHNWEDPTCAYHERCSSAASRYGRRVGKGEWLRRFIHGRMLYSI
ncbi:hypothetical protein L226DRAFT_25322 [Lentinus tigrinus ALCF2SS1-7]|uniref:uncharacterized protein n=1 Tax=Lentinus tigrinus ALCF2SS1-7 TaxID=1328758 RepID=UPI001165ED05|nr:hypothetical protein L226DRAFT_25322 [Lentinus tigrinus ALCF2SS1-7]